MKLRNIRKDAGKSLGGVWWDFERGDRVDTPNDKLCLLIAEDGNPQHRDAEARLRLQFYTELRAGGERAKAAYKQISARARAEAILLGWANMEDDDGTPIVYSVEKAAELLLDETLWGLGRFVEDVSRAASIYSADQEVKAKGN